MSKETGTARVKRGMAEMLKGGVIMDSERLLHADRKRLLALRHTGVFRYEHHRDARLQ
jgi:hypothetical protein